MTNTTLPTLSAGSTIQAADLFLTRQGSDTVDKKITGTQLIAFVNANAVIAASALTGTALASGVVTSSLTRVGTIATGVWQGTAVADAYIASATTWNNKISDISNLVTAGTNITITGSGTLIDPYVVNASFSGSSANTWTGQQTFNSLAIILGTTTANTALATDSNKKVVSSSTTDVELGYVHGVTSAIQTQINGKQATGSYLTALTGDATASGPGSAALTLATVNSNVGSFGSSTAIPVLTVNGKGLVTAASTAVVIAPAGTLTGSTLAAGVTASSLTSFGASPTLVTPTLGVASATTINKVTITAPATGSTLTIADGFTLTVSANATVSGTNTGDQTNISGNAATVTTNANLTGPVTSVGNATTISAGVVTNAMLAGSIDLATKVTGVLGSTHGGAGAVSGILKANGSGTVSAAASGTDYVVPGAAVSVGVVVTEPWSFAVSDETTALTTGAAKLTDRAPYAFTPVSVKASVSTAPTGAAITADVKKNGVSIFTTIVSIDIGATTSVGSAAPSVLVGGVTFAADDVITIDIDQVGSTIPGAGLKVQIIGHQ